MERMKCLHCIYKPVASKVLNTKELDEFDKYCVLTDFTKGEMIIKQKALSSSVAYICNGLVKIHTTIQKREKTLRIVKAPSYLCLPNNFCESYNHFSATAIENSKVCFLDLTVFKKIIVENGDFAYQIILNLSQNELYNLHTLIDNMQKHSTGRIAKIIIYFARNIYNNLSFYMPIGRQDIADLADTTRENVSRFLSELHSERIINIEGKKIEILNETLLYQISDKG